MRYQYAFASGSVMPLPAAAFSALQTTACTSPRALRSRTAFLKIRRPGLPTMSPVQRSLKS